MNSKTMIAVIAVVAVIGVSAGILIMSSGGDDRSSADAEYSATVWLDDGNKETKYSGIGKSVKEIVENAVSDRTVVFNSNGNVTSVDGVGNTNENAWVLFKWASPNGWATLSDKSPSIDGMTIALRYADRTVDDKGSVDYSAPDVEVEYKVYFFIQWKEQYNSTSWMQRLALTDSEKQAGVWIEGWGSNANEALADATLKYFYPGSSCTIDDTKEDQIIYSVDGEEGFYTYGTKSASYGWFLEYLGWSDTKKSDDGGDYGTWTYWSQYTYHPDAKSLDDPAQWGYNQTTFGMYDITKQRYFGLVLQTTVAETDGTDIQLPAPSTIPAGL